MASDNIYSISQVYAIVTRQVTQKVHGSNEKMTDQNMNILPAFLRSIPVEMADGICLVTNKIVKSVRIVCVDETISCPSTSSHTTI